MKPEIRYLSLISRVRFISYWEIFKLHFLVSRAPVYFIKMTHLCKIHLKAYLHVLKIDPAVIAAWEEALLWRECLATDNTGSGSQTNSITLFVIETGERRRQVGHCLQYFINWGNYPFITCSKVISNTKLSTVHEQQSIQRIGKLLLNFKMFL